MDSEDYIGKVIIGRTGQGEIKFVGQCVAYTDRPTLTVQLPDGEQQSWIADLCEVVAIDSGHKWLLDFVDRHLKTAK